MCITSDVEETEAKLGCKIHDKNDWGGLCSEREKCAKFACLFTLNVIPTPIQELGTERRVKFLC